MAGLTRKCRAGETLIIGEATVTVVKTGKKAVINIQAPPHVAITYDQSRLKTEGCRLKEPSGGEGSGQ